MVCFITFKYALTAHLMCIKNNFMILCMHIKCALYMHLYASDMFQLDMYVILCIFIKGSARATKHASYAAARLIASHWRETIDS